MVMRVETDEKGGLKCEVEPKHRTEALGFSLATVSSASTHLISVLRTKEERNEWPFAMYFMICSSVFQICEIGEK